VHHPQPKTDIVRHGFTPQKSLFPTPAQNTTAAVTLTLRLLRPLLLLLLRREAGGKHQKCKYGKCVHCQVTHGILLKLEKRKKADEIASLSRNQVVTQTLLMCCKSVVSSKTILLNLLKSIFVLRRRSKPVRYEPSFCLLLINLSRSPSLLALQHFWSHQKFFQSAETKGFE
jgi:hypothetical protein